MSRGRKPLPKTNKIEVAVHVAVSPELRRKLKIKAMKKGTTLNKYCLELFEESVKDIDDLDQ